MNLNVQIVGSFIENIFLYLFVAIVLRSLSTFAKNLVIRKSMDYYPIHNVGHKGQFTMWTMKSDHRRWHFPMVQLPWSDFLKKKTSTTIYKAFGPLTRRKLNVDQEEWPRIKKMNVLHFCNICPSREILKKRRSSLTILLSSHVFVFLFPKKSLINHYNNISLPCPCLFLPLHIFCLSHRKTRWTVSLDNVSLQICLLETSNFMITPTFISWCKPKSSRSEFNNQSQTLHGLGMT